MTRRRPISRRLAFVLRFNIAIGRNNGPIASHQMGEPPVYFSFSRSYVHVSRYFFISFVQHRFGIRENFPARRHEKVEVTCLSRELLR